MATAHISSSSSSEDELEDIDYLVPEAKISDHFESLSTDGKRLPATTKFLEGVSGINKRSGAGTITKLRIQELRQRSHGLSDDMPLANRKHLNSELFPTLTPEEEKKMQSKSPNINTYVQQMRDIVSDMNNLYSMIVSGKFAMTGSQAFDLFMQLWNHAIHLLSIKRFSAPRTSFLYSNDNLNLLEDICSEFDGFVSKQYGQKEGEIKNWLSLESEEGQRELLKWVLDVAKNKIVKTTITAIVSIMPQIYPPHTVLPVQETLSPPIPKRKWEPRKPRIMESEKSLLTKDKFKTKKSDPKHTSSCQCVYCVKPPGKDNIAQEIYSRGFWGYALHMALIGDQLEDMFEWITGEDCELIMTSKTARELWYCMLDNIMLLLNIYQYTRKPKRVEAMEDPEMLLLNSACKAALQGLRTNAYKLTTVADYRQRVFSTEDSLRQIFAIIRRKMPTVVNRMKQKNCNLDVNKCKKSKINFLDAMSVNVSFREIQRDIQRARQRTDTGNRSASHERITRSGIRIPNDIPFLNPPSNYISSIKSRPQHDSSSDVYVMSSGDEISVSIVSAENAAPSQRQRSGSHIQNTPSSQMQTHRMHIQDSQSPRMLTSRTHVQDRHSPQMQTSRTHIQSHLSPQSRRPRTPIENPQSPQMESLGRPISPIIHRSGTHIQNPHHTQIQNHAQGSPQTSISGIYVQNYGSPQTPRYVTHGQNSLKRQISGQRIHAQSPHYPQMSPSGVHHSKEHRYSHTSRSDFSRQNPQHSQQIQGMYAQNPQLSKFIAQNPQIPLSPSSSSHGMFDHAAQYQPSPRSNRQH